MTVLGIKKHFVEFSKSCLIEGFKTAAAYPMTMLGILSQLKKEANCGGHWTVKISGLDVM